jgi:hypothetical protein
MAVENMSEIVLATLCPWCRSSQRDDHDRCTNCGGPLHTSIDQRVPPPPRELPRGYAFRRLWLNVGSLVGGIFMGIAGIIIAAGIVQLSKGSSDGWWFVLLPSIHFAVGLGLFVGFRRSARKQLRALVHGSETEGVITDSAPDLSESINTRHPWRLAYTFNVRGEAFSGSLSTYSILRAQRYRSGDRVRVVCWLADPTCNCIYPPL